MYFSARAKGRISYGHLSRTNSCFFNYFTWNGPKMFVDLDWSTNASSALSASAELLVY